MRKGVSVRMREKKKPWRMSAQGGGQRSKKQKAESGNGDPPSLKRLCENQTGKERFPNEGRGFTVFSAYFNCLGFCWLAGNPSNPWLRKRLTAPLCGRHDRLS